MKRRHARETQADRLGALATGLEPATGGFGDRCSTVELRQQEGADRYFSPWKRIRQEGVEIVSIVLNIDTGCFKA